MPQMLTELVLFSTLNQLDAFKQELQEVTDANSFTDAGECHGIILLIEQLINHLYNDPTDNFDALEGSLMVVRAVLSQTKNVGFRKKALTILGFEDTLRAKLCKALPKAGGSRCEGNKKYPRPQKKDQTCDNPLLQTFKAFIEQSELKFHKGDPHTLRVALEAVYLVINSALDANTEGRTSEGSTSFEMQLPEQKKALRFNRAEDIIRQQSLEFQSLQDQLNKKIQDLTMLSTRIEDLESSGLEERMGRFRNLPENRSWVKRFLVGINYSEFLRYMSSAHTFQERKNLIKQLRRLLGPGKQTWEAVLRDLFLLLKDGKTCFPEYKRQINKTQLTINDLDKTVKKLREEDLFYHLVCFIAQNPKGWDNIRKCDFGYDIVKFCQLWQLIMYRGLSYLSEAQLVVMNRQRSIVSEYCQMSKVLEVINSKRIYSQEEIDNFKLVLADPWTAETVLDEKSITILKHILALLRYAKNNQVLGECSGLKEQLPQYVRRKPFIDYIHATKNPKVMELIASGQQYLKQLEEEENAELTPIFEQAKTALMELLTDFPSMLEVAASSLLREEGGARPARVAGSFYFKNDNGTIHLQANLYQLLKLAHYMQHMPEDESTKSCSSCLRFSNNKALSFDSSSPEEFRQRLLVLRGDHPEILSEGGGNFTRMYIEKGLNTPARELRRCVVASLETYHHMGLLKSSA